MACGILLFVLGAVLFSIIPPKRRRKRRLPPEEWEDWLDPLNQNWRR